MRRISTISWERFLSTGRVQFFEREDLYDVDEEIAELNDGMVFLDTDEYTIDDDIDEFKENDAHLSIDHDDTYVIGDAP